MSDHYRLPGTSEDGYLGSCRCQSRGDAWPCRSAATSPAAAVTDAAGTTTTPSTDDEPQRAQEEAR